MHLGFFIDMQNVNVLIIGGGKVARRKAFKLHNAGANVTLIAPSFISQFKPGITCVTDSVHAQNFATYIASTNPQFILLATDDKQLHPELVKICKQHNILVNDAQNGSTQLAFANTSTFNDSKISYYSHGDMEASRRLKKHFEKCLKKHSE